jgi:hypothetical protein
MSVEELVLRDAVADEALRDRGFVVLPVLPEREIQPLIDRWRQLSAAREPAWDHTGFASTADEADLRFEQEAHLRTILGPAVDAVFVDHEPFFSAFMAKRPGAGVLAPHLDWSFSDETVRTTYHCWTALTPVTAENGALAVVPGSHHAVNFRRSREESYDDWAVACFESHRDEVQVVPLAPGQGLVYDIRLVHLSVPNTTERTRLGVSCAVAHRADVPGARSILLTGLGATN